MQTMMQNGSLETGATPAFTLPTLGDHGPYNILANRPKLVFRENYFWKVCRILGLNNDYVHGVWRAQLIWISQVEEMIQIIPQQVRVHFLKVYATFVGTHA